MDMLWITSSWNSLDHPKDTTLRLMQEGLRLGVGTAWAPSNSIHIQNGRTYVWSRRLLEVGERRREVDFRFDRPTRILVEAFASVQMRVDPPIDTTYTNLLKMLASNKGPEIVNPASILLESTSKLEVARLSDVAPKTLIASDWKSLLEFGLSHHKTIMKPVHKLNNIGVKLLKWSNKSAVGRSKASISALSRGFRQPVVLQESVALPLDIELRWWYLDGKLLASVQRRQTRQITAKTCLPHYLSSAELTLSGKISAHLKMRGIRLAAADILNGYLLELNFASPGLLVETEKALEENLSSIIIKRLRRL
jgi:glutathione synthase/RimK-type ligase-like ATP-grasp enzyme